MTNIDCFFRSSFYRVFNGIDHKKIVPNVSSFTISYVGVTQVVVNTLVFFVVYKMLQNGSEKRTLKIPLYLSNSYLLPLFLNILVMLHASRQRGYTYCLFIWFMSRKNANCRLLPVTPGLKSSLM